MMPQITAQLAELPLHLACLLIVLPLSLAFAYCLYDQCLASRSTADWSDATLSSASASAGFFGRFETTPQQPGASPSSTSAHGPPHTWRQHFAAAKYGTSQSPINIDTGALVPLRRPLCAPIVWHGFEQPPCSYRLHNTGAALMLWPCGYAAGQLPTISSAHAPTPCTYALQHISVHWPAEHSVDHRQFALEVQSWYAFQMAPGSRCLATSAALAVAYLFRVAGQPGSAGNPLLQPLVSRLAEVRKADSRTVVKGFPLSWLCAPLDEGGFYDYEGSLTRPPCTENVTWLVSCAAGQLSADQLAQFRQLRDARGQRIECNARPVQRLNGRAVHFNRVAVS